MCSKLGQDILTAREREVNVGTSKKQTKLCQNIKDHLIVCGNGTIMISLIYILEHCDMFIFLLCAVLFYKRKANNKVPGQGPRIFGRHW